MKFAKAIDYKHAYKYEVCPQMTQKQHNCYYHTLLSFKDRQLLMYHQFKVWRFQHFVSQKSISCKRHCQCDLWYTTKSLSNIVCYLKATNEIQE